MMEFISYYTDEEGQKYFLKKLLSAMFMALWDPQVNRGVVTVFV